MLSLLRPKTERQFRSQKLKTARSLSESQETNSCRFKGTKRVDEFHLPLPTDGNHSQGQGGITPSDANVQSHITSRDVKGTTSPLVTVIPTLFRPRHCCLLTIIDPPCTADCVQNRFGGRKPTPDASLKVMPLTSEGTPTVPQSS